MPEPVNNLRAVLISAGIEPEQLADAVGVDIKTVQRWLTGRVPRGRHRRNVARALDSTERDLWPDATPPAPVVRSAQDTAGPGDVVSSHARANDPDVPDPIALIADAEDQIQLLDDTLISLLSRPGVTALLDEKARAGCEIQILILHPGAIYQLTHFARGGDRAPKLPYWQDPANLAKLQAERAHGYLTPLLLHPTVQARHHTHAGTSTIIRADDHLLITHQLPWGPPEHLPVLHLAHQLQDGLFQRYSDHLKNVWDGAREDIAYDPEHYPHPDQDPDRYLPLQP